MKRLALASMIVSLSFVAVACAAGGDTEEQAPKEETSSLGLPLSAECAACAESALVGECHAELVACADDASCFDVQGCLAGCEPGDAGCFGDCADASVKFATLTTCVLCDTCGDACSGEWSCEGGEDPNDPNDPENPEDPNDPEDQDPNQPDPDQCANADECLSCVQCAVDGGPCTEAWGQCKETEGCVHRVECAQSCGNDPACFEECAAQGPDGGAEAFHALAQCLLAPGVCGGVCEL